MMALLQTAIKTVIQNKKVISWGSEPPIYAMGDVIIFCPVIYRPLWVRSLLDSFFLHIFQ